MLVGPDGSPVEHFDEQVQRVLQVARPEERAHEYVVARRG